MNANEIAINQGTTRSAIVLKVLKRFNSGKGKRFCPDAKTLNKSQSPRDPSLM
jgi:hypothetical protein